MLSRKRKKGKKSRTLSFNFNKKPLNSKCSNSHFNFPNNKKILKSKCSQIPATITWFVAFTIIFFIMILFTIASIKLAETKKVANILQFFTQPVSVSESYGDVENLISNLMLNSILNKKVEYENEKISLEKLIGRWHDIAPKGETSKEQEKMKEKIEQEVKSILEKTKSKDVPYYIFIAEYEYTSEASAQTQMSEMAKGYAASKYVYHTVSIEVKELPAGRQLASGGIRGYEDFLESIPNTLIYTEKGFTKIKLALFR